MSVAIGIVAHTSRAEQAYELRESVTAAYLSMDDGGLGCEANHRKVWKRLGRYNSTWSVVLEDDAQPIGDFRERVTAALEAAPTDVVSFYLGHPQHWRDPVRNKRIAEAGAEAERINASWITTVEVLHGVAIAIRTHLIGDMLDHVERSSKPIDYAIRQWCRDTGRSIGFTWPSLVDHADGPTLVKHQDGRPRNTPRKAFKPGVRECWTSRSVTC